MPCLREQVIGEAGLTRSQYSMQVEAWQAATPAEHAAQHIRSVQRLLPRPACLLAGIGCAAVVAHELGVQLQSAGVEVGLDARCGTCVARDSPHKRCGKWACL